MLTLFLGKPKRVNGTCKDQVDISKQDQLIQNTGVYICQRGFEQQSDCIFCLQKIKTRSLLTYCCPCYSPTEQLQQLSIVHLETSSASSPLMHPENDPIKEEFKTGRQRGGCMRTGSVGFSHSHNLFGFSFGTYRTGGIWWKS